MDELMDQAPQASEDESLPETAEALRERCPRGRVGDQPIPAGLYLVPRVRAAVGAVAVVKANRAELDTVHCFGLDVVPELLQTVEYAGTLLRWNERPVTLSTADPVPGVELLAEPGLLVDGGPQPLYTFVIDEAVFHRPVGGSAVMYQQVRHILACAELPHVTVQVMPLGPGCHLALTAPTLVCVGLQDIWVYAEGPNGMTWIPDLTRAVPLAEAYHQMRAHALPPAESAQLLTRVAAELAADAKQRAA